LKAVELEQQAADPSLWDDPARGQRLTTKLARLRAEIDRYDSFQRRLDDARAMDELLQSESDLEMEAELARAVRELDTDLGKMELATLLGGEFDQNDAVATLHAGAGGTESQDWAEMLLRMYLRWAERTGLDVEVDDVLYGDEAGIKSATFIVHGTNAYGLISAERGVHRLVAVVPMRCLGPVTVGAELARLLFGATIEVVNIPFGTDGANRAPGRMASSATG